MIDFRFTTITPDVDYVDYVDRIMWTKMNHEDKMPIQSCLKETQIDDFPINDKDLKTSLPPWLHDLIMKSSFVILVILLNLVFIWKYFVTKKAPFTITPDNLDPRAKGRNCKIWDI